MMRLRLSLALGLALSLAQPGAPAGAAEALLRASATAAPVHGFYDHVGLFPVPILNLSLAYTDASLEPGPRTRALGSFLWDPEAAELGTIICVLSEGQVCGLPEYPFQARASYPEAEEAASPPTLSLEDPEGTVGVRLAYEQATADGTGATAEADVNRFFAVPMTPSQRHAIGELRAVLASVGGHRRLPAGDGGEPGWLVAVEVASSRSGVSDPGGGVEAFASSRLKGFQLLGGLVTIDLIRGRVLAALGTGDEPEADSKLVGLQVAGYEATVGPRGVSIAGEELGGEELAQLNEALNDAFAEVGLALSRGHQRVRETSGGVEAEASALTLELRAALLPPDLPEGTQGPEVLEVPLGFARAEAAVAELGALGGPPGGEIAGPGGDFIGFGGSGGFASPPEIGPTAPGAPEGEAETPPAVPIAGVLDLGIPLWAFLLAVVGGFALVVGLVWLRVVEVLKE